MKQRKAVFLYNMVVCVEDLMESAKKLTRTTK